jgi:hypothetical protein
MILDKILQVIQLLNEIDEYDEEIPKLQSNVDSRLSDVYHYIENNTLKTAECYRATRLIHDLRQERRRIKNDSEILRTYRTHIQKITHINSRGMLQVELQKANKRLESPYNNRVYTTDELEDMLKGRGKDERSSDSMVREGDEQESTV